MFPVNLIISGLVSGLYFVLLIFIMICRSAGYDIIDPFLILSLYFFIIFTSEISALISLVYVIIKPSFNNFMALGLSLIPWIVIYITILTI